MTGLVLASASPARARLLAAAGVAFTVHPASVDETAMKDSLQVAGADARAVAEALAELKAAEVSAAMPDALVLGADQVLVFDGVLVSKCADLDAARALLRELRGQPHDLISAAVLCLHGAPVWRHCAAARLTMRDFSDDFLDAYLAEEDEALLGGVGCLVSGWLGPRLAARLGLLDPLRQMIAAPKFIARTTISGAKVMTHPNRLGWIAVPRGVWRTLKAAAKKGEFANSSATTPVSSTPDAM